MKTLTIVLSLLMSTSAFSEVLQGGKRSTFRLGFGVNPLTEQMFDECIEYDSGYTVEAGKDPNAQQPISVESPFAIEQVTSYSQLEQYTSESVSGGVSHAFASGALSSSRNSANTMVSDRIMVGIRASSDYGRYYLRNVRLKPKYEELSREDIGKFYEVCGTEYISGFRLGQGIKVLMTASTDVSMSFESVSTAVSAGINYGGFGAGIAGAFANTAASLIKLGTLQVDVSIFGGGELKDAHQILRTDGDAKAFRDIIANYLQSLGSEKAERTEYITQPYFPGRGYDPLMSEVKRRTVKRLYDDFRYLTDNQDRMNTAFSGNISISALGSACATADRHKICADYVAGLKKINEEIISRLERIHQAVTNCIGATKVADCVSYSEDRFEMDRLKKIVWPAAFRYQLLRSNLDEIRKR